MRFDTIWHDARLATLAPGRPGLGIVERGAVAAKDGRIVFAGPAAELPADSDAARRVALDGRWITPGLIDCHTHLVYAGDRAHEFELRLAGASYEDIARAGGGIVSTVKATRAASEDDLVRASLPRLDRLIAEGVTTVEIKSGYGLDRATEMRMLAAARRLGRERDIDVVTSFLGAHALPPEADGDKDRYIDEVCAMIPAVAARPPRRRGRCVLRGHCVLARADRAGVRGRAGGGTAGEAACRPALQPRRREARGRARRALGRPSRIHRRGRRRRDGPRRHDSRAAARRVLRAARKTDAPGRGAAPAARADRDRDRQQSRHLADHVAAPDHEHGGDAVPPDRR